VLAGIEVEKQKKQRDVRVAIYASLITFLTYASVYAFRKPFTVAGYTDERSILGLPYKDALVISQLLGYMYSKFYGIKFIAELKKLGRGKMILMLVGISWFSLLLFAIVPAPWNIIFLFVNGFPLGIIWGIVFSFVEGRRTTDFIGSALAVSFIFSSGFVKSVAKWLMIDFNVNEHWIPFVTGLLFFIPLLLLVYLLERIPTPSLEDMEARVTRLPMNKQERKGFVKEFRNGLYLLIGIYVLLTVFRDIRDNFAADMWKEMGFGNHSEVFTATEVPITILVLILIGSMIVIRNNAKAFFVTHWIIILGFIIAGVSSWLFSLHYITPFVWMTLVGLGLYIGYIPFNCILFERMIATFKYAGNVGFLMYLADSFGYSGSVAVLLTKSICNIKLRWTDLYCNGVIYLSFIGVAGTLLAMNYFHKKHKNLSY
jgi:MFS family permease